MTIKDVDWSVGVVGRRQRGSYNLTRLSVKLAQPLVDVAVIVAVGFAAAIFYHRALFGDYHLMSLHRDLVLLVAGLFLLLNVVRGRYQVGSSGLLREDLGADASLWMATFAVMIAIGFITKTTDLYSRALFVTLFCLGLPAVILERRLISRLTEFGARVGLVPSRRVMLIGRSDDISTFALRYKPWRSGMHVAGTGLVGDDIRADLARIARDARDLKLDDVMIVMPWSQTERIDQVVDAFMRLPVTVHLAPEPIFDRFDDVRIAKTGGIASLQIGRPPLTAGEILAKRLMDLTLATLALVILAPVMAVVALAIKLDSSGPVFFRQRRLGFNQKVFTILKFRTMTTLDDGDVIRQATAGDARITRVGRTLRRLNLDELPQLFNVILGDMSLVGPRPHALAHDRAFEGRIALYARRHNVKPGITGWAQVHGLRGETDTDDKMRARVEHDLYYIDNWSLMLDIEILLRTMFSAKAYSNAV